MSDLIIREQAIQTFIDWQVKEFGYADLNRGERFIDAIESIPATEPKVVEWILCEERLPNETKARYLICTDDGYMCMCRWTNVNIFWTGIPTDWHWNLYDVPQYSKVVAWMPIEPYKMERGE